MYPLRGAVELNLPETIQLLISLGANPNSPVEHDSPLLHTKSLIVFQQLLECGADLNKIVRQGLPVFMHLLLHRNAAFGHKTEALLVFSLLDDVINRCDVNRLYSGVSFADVSHEFFLRTFRLTWFRSPLKDIIRRY